MATVAPPPSKRQKREQTERTKIQQDVTPILEPADMGAFRARFVDADGNQMADAVEINLADATEKNVSALLNTLLGRDPEDFTPYRFRIQLPGSKGAADPVLIDQYPSSAADFLALLRLNGLTDPFETTITLSAEPQSVFRVRAVSRLAHRIPGHSKEILTAQWSPRPGCRLLATGSGDNCARLWDADTGTPKSVLKGHTGWVLDVRWSPDGARLATCGMDKTVRIWDPEAGTPVGRELRGHAKWVAMLAWEPYHLWRDGSPRLASASKDGTVRIWIVNTGRTEHVLSHKASVSCVRWGATGTGRIYTSSHDKLVRVYDAVLGTLVHSLAGHAHWVNHLALSTDFVLSTGFYEPGGADGQAEVPTDEESGRELARERFDKAAKKKGEIVEKVVSASDDFTMYLWSPTESGTKPVARMQGHQKSINHVAFSPDGTLIASASWDNSSKLWNARDGKFINTLRGHVAPVYRCAFSADSRLLVTASKDTTLKIWNVRAAKLAMDLVGHEDEVYAVDWAPDGSMIGSGGKDKAVRIWRH